MVEYQSVFGTMNARLNALETDNALLKKELAATTAGLASAMVALKLSEKSAGSATIAASHSLEGKLASLAKKVSNNDSHLRAELGKLAQALNTR
jgi:hypothetical protein